MGHNEWTRYVKLRVAQAPGMPGTFWPRHWLERRPLVSDPGMHHGTCVTHVPWCMSGSLTRGGGGNVPGDSRRMRNPQSYVFIRGPWALITKRRQGSTNSNCYPEKYECFKQKLGYIRAHSTKYLQQYEQCTNQFEPLGTSRTVSPNE